MERYACIMVLNMTTRLVKRIGKITGGGFIESRSIQTVMFETLSNFEDKSQANALLWRNSLTWIGKQTWRGVK